MSVLKIKILGVVRDGMKAHVALTSRQVWLFFIVSESEVKGTGNQKTPAVVLFFLSLQKENKKKSLGAGWGRSRFALGGICLCDTVVICSDQGVW